ncbi:MAG: ADP-forming succinate--CoA ligase subunit beta [Helicobacteraceae bacterium]|nr:ADP-forming succinate--CoA ligase subunit beta [Helicobacteraceae bacterium]
MNIHEYQAKELFRRFGVPTLAGAVAFSAEEARSKAEEIGGDLWVIKAQVHAGGRGKGGGVKLARSFDEVEAIAAQILGSRLITNQTGADGKIVNRLYVESGADIQKEFYLAITLDRALESPCFIASAEGGMEIEEIARNADEKIIRVAVEPAIGFQPFHARKLAFALNLPKEAQSGFIALAKALFTCYETTDANLIEINPLALLGDNRLVALDAKAGFDDNALFRHTEIAAMRDAGEEEASEIEARQYNLSYVKLDGGVGCMVNGAGLAMATMDIIKGEGGLPANFLDIGGGASSETVAKGFEIILRDPNVKSIFINIFGGIARCDRVANGILEATRRVGAKLPIVVRLDGTNADLAKRILQEANMPNVIAADELSSGAKQAVGLAKGN